MSQHGTFPKITIVGAGLAGAFMAACLGQRGFAVNVYERRDDPRTLGRASGPSMNLGLSRRGVVALTQIGLIQRALEQSIPMRGRMIHAVNGSRSYQPYGQDSSQVIHAVRRTDLNIALIELAASLPNVQFHFNLRCVELDKQTATVTLVDERHDQRLVVQADLVIGADGIFSRIRRDMQRGERANYQQEFLEWGWKELIVPPGPDSSFQFEKHMFHLWPRGDHMIFAHPNLDGSFCCSFVLPYSGPNSIETLQCQDTIETFFKTNFADLEPMIPDLAAHFLRNPTIPLMSTRTSQWYYQQRVVLIGDACHAVFPFYAQGMNSAFEDCLTLTDCLCRHLDAIQTGLAEYQRLRKPNTDALADISRENFTELRDTVRSSQTRLRKRVDRLLGRLFPDRWVPLHAMITNMTLPYAQAVARARRQDRWLRGLGMGGSVALATLGGALWRWQRTSRRDG